MRHLNFVSLSLCVALVMVITACRDKTPSGTTGTAGSAVKVTDVTLGRAIGGDKAVTDPTDNFRPNDTIYASVATDGSSASTTLRARWTYEGGQVVDESTRAIAQNNRERTEFHIAKPDGWPTGKYQVEVFLDGRSVETKKFEVKAN
jgi:Large extracellular alpha-helical protein